MQSADFLDTAWTEKASDCTVLDSKIHKKFLNRGFQYLSDGIVWKAVRPSRRWDAWKWCVFMHLSTAASRIAFRNILPQIPAAGPLHSRLDLHKLVSG